MKTTKEDFEKFKRIFKYWLKKSGMTQYNVVFKHEWVPGASADIDIEASNDVVVRLSTDRDVSFGISSMAKHEFGHLVLAELIRQINPPKYTAKMLSREESTADIIALLLGN